MQQTQKLKQAMPVLLEISPFDAKRISIERKVERLKLNFNSFLGISILHKSIWGLHIVQEKIWGSILSLLDCRR